MKRLLATIQILWMALLAVGQPKVCTFTHYSSKDGLPENTVMYMMQDHQGFMWFATWDGFCRFDGYDFKVYKPHASNHIPLTNSRVNWMGEDRWGYIWLWAYDYSVYRFDPRTEKFDSILTDPQGESVQASKVQILPDGHVWLTGLKGGAACVSTQVAEPHRLSVRSFPPSSHTFPAQCLQGIHTDAEGNAWLLTDGGLGMCRADSESDSINFFFSGSGAQRQAQPFYSCCELGEQLYFGSDEGRILCYHRREGNFRLISLPDGGRVVDLDVLSDHAWLATTYDQGLFLYDAQADRITPLQADRYPQLASVHLKSAYVDSSGVVWLEAEEPHTVIWLHSQTLQMKCQVMKEEVSVAVNANPAFHIHEDIHHVVWIHPYAGGFCYYDRTEDVLKPFYDMPHSAGWRFSARIHSAMSDCQGNLWLCTHSKGLERISFSDRKFRLFTIDTGRHTSFANNVRTIYQSRDSCLWIGTKEGLLYQYDLQLHSRGYLTQSGEIASKGNPLPGVVYSLLEDKKGRFWIGTRGNGLYCATRKGRGYQLSHFCFQPDDIYSLSDNSVFSLYKDRQGVIWIATYGGGVNYVQEDLNGIRFINYRNHLKNYPIHSFAKVRYVTGDAQDYLWLGTSNGVVRFRSDSPLPEQITFHTYEHLIGDNTSLSSNEVYRVIPTRQGPCWLLTFGGGICQAVEQSDGSLTFRSFGAQEGLMSDILLSGEEDCRSHLWFTSEEGITEFVPHTGNVRNFMGSDIGLGEAQFNEAASSCGTDGTIWLGTTQGILHFHPDSIRGCTYIPQMAFTQLSVMNNVESPSSAHSCLSVHINETSQLMLPHDRNMFTLTFAALDFTDNRNIRYAYRLEGFDREWICTEQRSATYTNLPPGRYRFCVRSTNREGMWVTNQRSINIHIRSPYWDTPLAWILYALATMALTYLGYRILYIIFRLKHDVRIEQEVANAKLRFFTDISHELRSPLTLITAPLEWVLRDSRLPAEVVEQLQLVQRNTDRMLRLVGQILDIRKMQNHKMSLCLQRVEVVSFVQHIMKNFEGMAHEHRLDLVFSSEMSHIFLWVDADKLEKIVFNLLSNAFKFTPDGKMIRVSLYEDAKQVYLEVQDQGIGIPEEKRKSLFVRFESHLQKNAPYAAGYGIGLSLVQELVHLHRGEITLQSSPGAGSTFTVALLKGRDHYDHSVEYVLQDAEPEAEETTLTHECHSPTISDSTGQPSGSKGVMLIVEDNAELRSFLGQMFKADYDVCLAADGQEGLEKALSLQPEVIISDVMMPRMDGVELTDTLRRGIATSHILIVLLTARTDTESRLKGLEVGADDYIIKPFSASYLKVRIAKLLQRRQQMQTYLTQTLMPDVHHAHQPMLTTSLPLQATNQDQTFVERFTRLVEQRIDHSELLVGDLAKEMGVSRTILFNKMKALTGLGPNDFIRELRLHRAAQLLANTDHSITDISYMVGINGSRYLARCFKEKYGMTPSEYRRSRTSPPADTPNIKDSAPDTVSDSTD